MTKHPLKWLMLAAMVVVLAWGSGRAVAQDDEWAEEANESAEEFDVADAEEGEGEEVVDEADVPDDAAEESEDPAAEQEGEPAADEEEPLAEGTEDGDEYGSEDSYEDLGADEALDPGVVEDDEAANFEEAEADQAVAAEEPEVAEGPAGGEDGSVVQQSPPPAETSPPPPPPPPPPAAAEGPPAKPADDVGWYRDPPSYRLPPEKCTRDAPSGGGRAGNACSRNLVRGIPLYAPDNYLCAQAHGAENCYEAATTSQIILDSHLKPSFRSDNHTDAERRASHKFYGCRPGYTLLLCWAGGGPPVFFACGKPDASIDDSISCQGLAD